MPVLGEVGEVIEQQAVAVEAKAREDGDEKSSIDVAAGREEESGERVTWNGEEIRCAEKLEPGVERGARGGHRERMIGES